MSEPDTTSDQYASLNNVLRAALTQAADGKGAERHARGQEPFNEQLGVWIQSQGFGFADGQAVKKIHEALRLPPDAAIFELLGAINYLAMAIIVLQGGDDGETEE